MGYEQFVREIKRTSMMLPYYNVSRNTDDADFRYKIWTAGPWTAYASDDLSMIQIETGELLVVYDNRLLLDGKEIEKLCVDNFCLTSNGIRVRLGAIILAKYSWIDSLTRWSTRQLLKYVDEVEKEPNEAKVAIAALGACNALSDEEVIRITMAVRKAINQLRTSV